ncbi:MAG: zinc ribbon domain-containing protein [Euryarchaeota archaeon]|nr:zinc ribbon domain-containing protein [Euryarchaeota archaeon]
MVSVEIISKGALVRAFSVVDPSIKRKRLIVNIALLDIFFLNGVLLFVGLYLTPSLLVIMLAMMALVSVVSIIQHLHLKAVLLRGAYPVTLYTNGFELPSFAFNRALRRPEFIKREEVASISVTGFPSEVRGGEMNGMRTINFKTRSGKTNDTGARSVTEVESAVDWIERNWGSKVERYGTVFEAHTATHTAHEVSVNTRYCPNCGKASDEMQSFCPFCGMRLDPEASAGNRVEAEPQQPPYALPYNPYQRTGSRNGTALRPRYDASEYPNGKDPRTAFFIGLLLGFLGFMGIGHIYLEKNAKGVVLLIAGGMLAVLSVTAWMTVLGPSEYPLGVQVATALILSGPYLVLQVWQAFDAPKPKKEWSRAR